MSSITPTAAISDRAGEDRPRLRVPGKPDHARGENPGEIARPPSLGVAKTCRLALAGWSIAPMRRASRSVSGDQQPGEDAPATRKCEERRSRLLSAGVAVEPEAEGHQAPDLAAEVLLRRDVAVEQRR